MKSSGLYIHIPFCTQKCGYCDFYSCVGQGDFTPYGSNRTFINRLLADIAFFKRRYDIEYWKTVYIGGGTPSLLSPADIHFLADGICKNQNIKIEEFTVEANPEDIHPEWLAACEEGGINRLSVGVQSFDDAVLAANGRRGAGHKTDAALNTIKRFWTGMLSCDLIAGLKEQSSESLADDLRRLIDYHVEHISLYGLCSEYPLSEDHEDAIYGLLTESFAVLRNNNYQQYEVSNFSYKHLYKSIHNQIYWCMEPYVGIGPAACGTLVYEDERNAFIRAERFEGIRDIERWILSDDRINVYTHEALNRAVFLEEVLLMGFRLTEGIERNRFRQRFGFDICTYIGETVQYWEKKGLCRILPDRVFLTDEGLFFLNRFLVDVLFELEHFH